MPGIRIRHEVLRGVTYTVEHPTRRYPKPWLCPACGSVHERKTYHLRLDAEGAAIVSEQVFQRLREAGMPGLEATNVVAEPPPQSIAIEGAPLEMRVERHEVEGRRPRRLQSIRNRLFIPRAPKE